MRFVSGGPGRKPFHTGPPDLREARGKSEEIDLSAATLPERGGAKGRRRDLMAFPPVL